MSFFYDKSTKMFNHIIFIIELWILYIINIEKYLIEIKIYSILFIIPRKQRLQYFQRSHYNNI